MNEGLVMNWKIVRALASGIACVAMAGAEQQPPPEREPINKTRPYNDARPADEPEQRAANHVILLAGTVLPVRIGETISAARNQKGDTFLATLDQPLVIDGFI